MKRKDDGVDVQGKQPCYYFYPADFERDVQMLSLSAQGLWIRMLGWMHFCERRGFLELPTGAPMSTDDIAAKVGKSKKEVHRAIAEMERIGLFSRDDRGCIKSRRMEKDTHISHVRKQAAASRASVADRDGGGKFAGDFAPAKSEICSSKNTDTRLAKVEQNTVLSLSPSLSSSLSPSGSIEARTPADLEDSAGSRNASGETVRPSLPPVDGFVIPEWFETLYAAHPKKGHRMAAERAASGISGIHDPATRRQISDTHADWCSSEEWTWKNGVKAPFLDEWLIDKGYRYRPPPRAETSESPREQPRKKSAFAAALERV